MFEEFTEYLDGYLDGYLDEGVLSRERLRINAAVIPQTVVGQD